MAIRLDSFEGCCFGKYVKAVDSLFKSLGEDMIMPGDKIKFIKKILNYNNGNYNEINYLCLIIKKNKELEVTIDPHILCLGIGDANIRCDYDRFEKIDFSGAVVDVYVSLYHIRRNEDLYYSYYDLFKQWFNTCQCDSIPTNLKVTAEVYSFDWETYPEVMHPENYLSWTNICNSEKDEQGLFKSFLKWWRFNRNTLTKESIEFLRPKIEECCKIHESFKCCSIIDYYKKLEKSTIAIKPENIRVYNLDECRSNRLRLDLSYISIKNLLKQGFIRHLNFMMKIFTLL